MSLALLTDEFSLCLLVDSSIQFLQRYSPQHGPAATPKETTNSDHGKLRIRCPRCRWQPRQRDRWACICGHAWNTFDTGGVCPECGKAWQNTQCLRCHLWSRHEDWYTWEEGHG